MDRWGGGFRQLGIDFLANPNGAWVLYDEMIQGRLNRYRMEDPDSRGLKIQADGQWVSYEDALMFLQSR
jgi:hypothetical protein